MRNEGERGFCLFFSSVLLFLVVGLGKLNCPRGLESGGYCFSYHFPPPPSLVIFDNTLPLVAAAAGALGCRIDGFLFIWRQDGTGLFALCGLGLGWRLVITLFWGETVCVGDLRRRREEETGDWRQREEGDEISPPPTAIINAHTFHVHPPPLSLPIVFPVVSRDREGNAFAPRGKMETMTLCVLGRRRREGRRQRRGGGE